MSDETERLKRELAAATEKGDGVAAAGLRYVLAYNEAGDDLDAQVEASGDIEKALSNTEHARILRRSAKAALVMADELEAGKWTIPADKQDEIDARALDLEKRWDAKGIEKAFVTEQQLKDIAARNKCPKCGEGSLRRQPGRDGEDVFACARGPRATGRGCGYNEQIEKAFVIPGQVPRKSPAMSLDELTAMPPPVNMAVARLASGPVRSIQGVTNGLIEEPTQARAFQNFVKSIVRSAHESIFRSQLMQHMKVGLFADPSLRKALMERALQFYKGQSIEKAEGDRGGHVIGHTSSGKPIYASEDAKGHAQRSADIGVQRASVKGAEKKAMHAERAELHERAAALYTHAGRTDAATDQTNAAALHWQRAGGKPTMEKAEPRGGNYHRRVTNDDGEHRYYYSEDDYAKRPDAHLDGATVKKQKAKAAVLAHVGDKGCTVDDLKALTAKHDPEHIADAVRAHVKAGTLKHANGKLMKNDDVKKGGEGSRGGHVVGHTGSGKPIYEHDKVAAKANYAQAAVAAKQASDAAEAHNKASPMDYSGLSQKFAEAERAHKAAKVASYDGGIHTMHQAGDHATAADRAGDRANWFGEKARTAEKSMSNRDSNAQADAEAKKSLHGWLAIQNGEHAMQKSEGERGGKVIGHTGSGKPIYESANHPAHGGFTTKDHFEAAQAHSKAFASTSPDSTDADRQKHKDGFAAHKAAWQASKAADADAVGMTTSGKRVQAPSSKLVSEHWQASQGMHGKPGSGATTAKMIDKHVKEKHADFSPAEHAEAAKMLRARGGAIASDKTKGKHQDARNDKAKLHYRVASAHDALAEAGGASKLKSPSDHANDLTDRAVAASARKPSNEPGVSAAVADKGKHQAASEMHAQAAKAHHDAAKFHHTDEPHGTNATSAYHADQAQFHERNAQYHDQMQGNVQKSNNEERTMKKGIEEGGASAPENKDLSDGANGGTDRVAFVSSEADDEASKMALTKGGLHAYIGKAFGDPPEPKDADEKADDAEADAEAAEAASDTEPKEPIEKGAVPPQFQKKPQQAPPPAQNQAPAQQSAPPQKGPPPPQKAQDDEEDEGQQQSAPAPQNGPQGQQAPPQAPPKKKPAPPAQQGGTYLPPASQQMQKGGLHGWLQKSNIPGAEDTSAGKTKGNLVEGGTPALDQDEGVNGPMLDLDGEGADHTGAPGGPNTVAAAVGGSDSGKTEVLNSDDPKPGEMNGDDVGIHTEQSPNPSGGPLGVGSLSKSTRYMDPADLVAPPTRRWGTDPPPPDVRYGVGRPTPAAPRTQSGPTASVVRKGMTTYSNAADLAVDALQKSDGWNADAALLDTPLQKSSACGSCGGSMPAYLTVCPSCGGDSFQKAQSAHPQRAMRGPPPRPLKLRHERDLVMPNGTKIEG